MKTLYFDCFSGISGDMSIGALIDIGVEFEMIKYELERLFSKKQPIDLSITRLVKCSVSALKFHVHSPFPETNLHGFEEIKAFIEHSKLTVGVKSLSTKIFENLAKAESQIHGIPIEKIHFHEIGAFDSVIDIVGFSVAFRSLGIKNVISSPIALGYGLVQCQHGKYPIPAMATLELLRSAPIYGGDHECELTTPTGAAIITTVATGYSEKLPKMQVEKIGYGAGTKDLEGQPNVLRVVCGKVFE